MLAPIRRLRVAWWLLLLRLRLRRQGMRLRVALGRNVRVAGRPRLDVHMWGGERGGSLTIGVGPDVRIGRDLVLDVRPGADHVLEVGAGAVFQDHVRFQLRGGTVRLGEHADVRDGCELKSAGELAIGRRVTCGRGATLHCARSVVLGDQVGLGPNVTIIDSDHAADGSDTWFLDRPLLADPIVLADNVWVGANVVVLRGAIVGANAVIAAGAVVNGGEHPAGAMLAGVPAQAVKDLG